MSMLDNCLIHLDDVYFSYDDVPVLQGADLCVGRRDFVSVVGPNGGGKTTLLKLILGLLTPQKGTIRVIGRPPEQARGEVGYVPQSFEYDPRFPVRVRDVVLMGRLHQARPFMPYSAEDREAATEALEQVELTELESRPLASLSGGQRQRVLVARALATRPQIMLLDEPTAHLDPAAEHDLFELLSRLNDELTIIVASHDISFVSRFVNKVACVRQTIAVHPTDSVKGELFADLYGQAVDLVRHDRQYPGGHDHD